MIILRHISEKVEIEQNENTYPFQQCRKHCDTQSILRNDIIHKYIAQLVQVRTGGKPYTCVKRSYFSRRLSASDVKLQILAPDNVRPVRSSEW